MTHTDASRAIVTRVTLILVLAALPACRITWRQPTIEPLNTNRIYAAELPAACDAAEQVVRDFGLEVKETQREDSACLVETEFKVLPDTGDEPRNHLRRVAYVGVGGFIGGRYTVTVTSRNSRDSGTRVKVVTRVEGYVNEEFGYQVLRSTGLIESEMFAAIGAELGTQPMETD